MNRLCDLLVTDHAMFVEVLERYGVRGTEMLAMYRAAQDRYRSRRVCGVLYVEELERLREWGLSEWRGIPFDLWVEYVGRVGEVSVASVGERARAIRRLRVELYEAVKARG